VSTLDQLAGEEIQTNTEKYKLKKYKEIGSKNKVKKYKEVQMEEIQSDICMELFAIAAVSTRDQLAGKEIQKNTK